MFDAAGAAAPPQAVKYNSPLNIRMFMIFFIRSPFHFIDVVWKKKFSGRWEGWISGFSFYINLALIPFICDNHGRV